MPVKRNHYLPQFYLARFMPSDGTSHFWVYDKKGGKPRRQTPINTGVEGHLYTVINKEGARDDSIETDFLAPIDGDVSPIIDKWATSGSIDPDDIPTMAAFLAVMHWRVPRNIEVMREYQEKYALALGDR